MEIVLTDRCLSNGKASSEAMVTKDPILLNGWIDPRNGVIVEVGHGLHGKASETRC
jgi:predicted aconitase with swiveling domain